MGLDVSFYAKTTKVVHSAAYPFDEECWDAHLVTYVGDFPDQADGIANKACFVTEGRDAHIHHSYGGYNIYREWLCMAALGVLPEVVWGDPEAWKGKPFYEQINFADNEGTIGPVTAAKLAADYVEQRDKVMTFFGRPDPVFAAGYNGWIETMPSSYDKWRDAFALVTETGIVRFA